MVSRAKIERLRLEADTIMTRYQQVEQLLAQARDESGEHWETGELTVTLDTPSGEPISITLDFDADPATNAQSRYERANEIGAELERQEQIDEQLAPLPADPVAYLVCYHLDYVDGDYPKSIAGHLDASRKHVDELCKEMEASGVLERIESGTVKQRNVKAKKAEEVRQHHTYYRLSREGDHLLRFLSGPEGQLNVLRHLPDSQTIIRRLCRTGVDSPRTTAEHVDMKFEYVRHLYRTLRQIGLLRECKDSGTVEEHQRSPKANSHNQTVYKATDRVEELLQTLKR